MIDPLMKTLEFQGAKGPGTQSQPAVKPIVKKGRMTIMTRMIQPIIRTALIERLNGCLVLIIHYIPFYLLHHHPNLVEQNSLMPYATLLES
jgi:hypothetical protein